MGNDLVLQMCNTFPEHLVLHHQFMGVDTHLLKVFFIEMGKQCLMQEPGFHHSLDQLRQHS